MADDSDKDPAVVNYAEIVTPNFEEITLNSSIKIIKDKLKLSLATPSRRLRTVPGSCLFLVAARICHPQSWNPGPSCCCSASSLNLHRQSCWWSGYCWHLLDNLTVYRAVLMLLCLRLLINYRQCGSSDD